MKKVYFINSPVIQEKSDLHKEDYLPPIGLGIVITSAHKNHDIQFIDCFLENYGLKELTEEIMNNRPCFCCINIFSTNYWIVKNLIEGITIKVNWIIGGISTRHLYPEILKWKTENSITIVYGDGENIINDLLDQCPKERYKASFENKYYYEVTGDSIYYQKEISYESLDITLFKGVPQSNYYEESEAYIYGSRGCPYNCAYCLAASSLNKEMGIRVKNEDSLNVEIKNLHNHYCNLKSIRVLDDLFLSNKKSIEQAIRIFSNYHLKWRAMCHIRSFINVPDDLLSNLNKSGCKELFVGIESGSEKILSMIHKQINPNEVKLTITRIVEAGISVKGYFIMGFPQETTDDLDCTLALAAQLSVIEGTQGARFRNSTFQFRPYYGTELCTLMINKGYLTKEEVLLKIRPSKEINQKVRNKSFNFDSGNYSDVSDETLTSYLKSMNDLNAKPNK